MIAQVSIMSHPIECLYDTQRNYSCNDFFFGYSKNNRRITVIKYLQLGIYLGDVENSLKKVFVVLNQRWSFDDKVIGSPGATGLIISELAYDFRRREGVL